MTWALHILLVWPRPKGPDGLPLPTFRQAAQQLIAEGQQDIHYMVDLGAKATETTRNIPCQEPLPGDPVIFNQTHNTKLGDGFGGTDPEAVHT